VTVLFVPRSTWFAGTPTSNSGTPRPRLRVPVPTITRHYTGSPPSVKASTWTAKEWMPWFQSVALASGKSYEYNYVIPPRADGSSQVWEYAGSYQAAHSAGENDVAVGVLFAIGVANHPSYASYDPTKPTVWEPLTDPMVHAYRWLRDEYLARQGIIHPVYVAEVEHRNMPGAATACPGVSVIARAADLTASHTPDLPPEEPVAVSYFKLAADSLTVWATSDNLIAVRLEGSQVNARGVDPFKVPVLPATEADKYVYHSSGLPRASVR
jgi:hypothetical protein